MHSIQGVLEFWVKIVKNDKGDLNKQRSPNIRTFLWGIV